jgi:predicted CXXCH cytochrome family protein
MTTRKFIPLAYLVLGSVMLLTGALLLMNGQTTYAQDDDAQPQTTEEVTTEGESADDDAETDVTAEPSDDMTDDEPMSPDAIVAAVAGESYCTVCHTPTTNQVHTLANGETFSVAVDPQTLANSVHGTDNEEGALSCVDCHGADSFPHDDPPFANSREYTITKSNMCVDCHEDQQDMLAEGVHYTALAGGNLRSASCVDCHGAHDVQPAGAREVVVDTCGNCHVIAYDEFAGSVHGQALIEENDPNVPTCISCHNVHGVQNPNTAEYRNASPQLCADCHADEELMNEYGISTNVFNSYLSDFHGTTVRLFEEAGSNMPANEAVCHDCHGAHGTTAMSEMKDEEVRENLLPMCLDCHPDATADFPAAWVGHFEPTFESHPILFGVNLFYDILIPVVLGGFVLLVITDIVRRIRDRFGGENH